MTLIEKLRNDDLLADQMLLPEEYSSAFLGLEYGSMRVIYSVSKIIEILMQDEEDDEDPNGQSAYEKAWDFFSYNIGGAYVGEMTPIYLDDTLLN